MRQVQFSRFRLERFFAILCAFRCYCVIGTQRRVFTDSGDRDHRLFFLTRPTEARSEGVAARRISGAVDTESRLAKKECGLPGLKGQQRIVHGATEGTRARVAPLPSRAKERRGGEELVAPCGEFQLYGAVMRRLS